MPDHDAKIEELLTELDNRIGTPWLRRSAIEEREMLIACRDALRAALADNARLAADAERLNWLDTLADTYHVTLHSLCIVDDTKPAFSWCLTTFAEDSEGPFSEWMVGIRAAIDAALDRARREKETG